MDYIDFHVHAFADRIAERTMNSLSPIFGKQPITNGTLSGTEACMDTWEVDGFVILPIATKPTQHLVCNNWAASCICDHIFPFGSVHPDGEDVLAELERIKELGLYGVKFHPDYQHFYVDEERLYPIYRKCGELGLPIVFHAGFDPVCPNDIHCTPQRAARILDKFPDTTMIMAHMGGNELWADVEMLLAGQFDNLYMDTALAGSYIPQEWMLRIIEKHGADKILLGSDCPWDDTGLAIVNIKKLGLTEKEERMIFADNAKRLLRL